MGRFSKSRARVREGQVLTLADLRSAGVRLDRLLARTGITPAISKVSFQARSVRPGGCRERLHKRLAWRQVPCGRSGTATACAEGALTIALAAGPARKTWVAAGRAAPGKKGFDMTVTEWAGRPASDLAAEAGTPCGLYLWLRASGKTAEDAVQQIARQSGYTNPYNLRRLAEQCARAEERERERAATPKPQPQIFESEALSYRVLRTGGGLLRRQAVDEVARRFHHGRVNRPALEARLSEVERELSKARPKVEVSAVAQDATRKLAELEQCRLRLAADALVDSEIRSELEAVEADIAFTKRTLELVSLARTAQPEEKAAA